MKKILIFLALVCCSVAMQAQTRISLRDAFSGKINRAKAALMGMYVDTLNEEKLIDNAIRGMLEDLDPHTQYSNAEEGKRMNEHFQGSFDGIGIQYRMVNDTLLVIKTVAGGPSEKAGLLPADKIIYVGDSLIAGVKTSQQDIYKKLRGPKNSKVTVKVLRKGSKKLLSFQIKRAAIPTQTIHAAYMVAPRVGYILLESFAMTSYNEFMQAVSRLQNEGMEALILDLQNNTGGILESAVKIANEFLSEGDLIVYGEGINYPRQSHVADGSGTLKEIPLYVLINEESASASEVIAGALQDQDRATIIGRRSFGKGCIQRPIPFSDGSMLRITVANFYSPSGRCIQKPFQKGRRAEYEKELANRETSGEIFSADSIHLNDSLKFETLKRHRTVYGGGGIVPDEFVPLDTTRISRLFTKMVAKGIVADHATNYWANHRAELMQAYPTLDVFLAKFNAPEALVQEIKAEAERQNLKPTSPTDTENADYRLRRNIKVLLATNLWDTGEGIVASNQDNQILQHALQFVAKQ